MGVTYLDSINVDKIYFYDASVPSYTARTVTGDDLFSDTAAVGDILYFGATGADGYQQFPWKDLTLSISTALAADSITIVWEWLKAPLSGADTWTAFGTSELVDGTLNFTQSGTVVFDPQSFWMGYYSGVTNRNYIRARITAVTNLTEGGAFDAQPTAKRNVIAIDGYSSGTPCRLSDVYTADLAGTRLLAPEMPCTTGMYVTTIYSAEMGAQKLIFTLSGTSAGAGDTIDITGTGPEGEAVTESIDVSAGDGAYTSAQSYTAVTSFNCTGWADGTVKVEQGRWGALKRLGFDDSYFGHNLYMADRCAFWVLYTGYFYMLRELLIVNVQEHYQTPLFRARGYYKNEGSAVILSSRVADSLKNRNDYGGIYLGSHQWPQTPNVDIDYGVIAYLNPHPYGQSFLNIHPQAGTVALDYTYLGTYRSEATGTRLGQQMGTQSRNVLALSYYWPGFIERIQDLNYSAFAGRLYLVSGHARAKFRNFTAAAVDDQYQANQEFYLQDVISDSWTATVDGTNTFRLRQHSLQVVVKDADGNYIEGASVKIEDSSGNMVHYHSESDPSNYRINTSYIDVVDGSAFSAGNVVNMRFYDAGWITATISSVSTGGGAGGLDRLNFTGAFSGEVHNADPVQNASVLPLTDSNGEIPLQYLTYWKTTSSGHTERFPHKITVTKDGYQDKVAYIVASSPREQVIVLEKQVGVYIGKGKAFVNTDPATNQNNILA